MSDQAKPDGPERLGARRFGVRIPYHHFDAQGVVFNMWYLAWFDEAQVDFLAAVGAPYPALLASGCDQQLVHTELDWRGPVRMGDQAEVEVWAERVGRTSYTLGFAVHRTAPGPAETTATGRTVYVTVAADGSGTVPVPDVLRTALLPPARPPAPSDEDVYSGAGDGEPPRMRP